jgi:hypothetical protein
MVARIGTLLAGAWRAVALAAFCLSLAGQPATAMASPNSVTASTTSSGVAAGTLQGSAGQPMAQQVPVPFDGLWQEFSFTGVGALARGCAPADPFGSICSPSSAANSNFVGPPPWTFIAGAFGADLVVTDAFNIGDRFEVFDFGIVLGQTSFVPITNGTCGDNPAVCLTSASHRTYHLLGGTHSITIRPTVSALGGGAAYFRVLLHP